MKKEPRTETDLIDFIRAAPQPFPSSVLEQIGDDCAILATSFASQLVVTTDLLLEDVHFRRSWMSPWFLGRKSSLVNLSDIAAMGARPHACLLSLGLPGEFTGDYFQAFVTGFLKECGRAGMPLIGGDLSRSEKVVISVTAWGYLDSGRPIRRSGAQPGDYVLLIGKTGYSRLGLEYLESNERGGLGEISEETELREWAGSSDCYEWLKAQLLPEVQREPAIWIAENELANAMIDISDGLGHDLLHILEESQLSGELELEKIPCPAGVEGVERALEYALSGGEDYALLLTVSKEQLEGLKEQYPEVFTPFIVIGRLYSGPAILYLKTADGRKSRYHSRGFEHFP